MTKLHKHIEENNIKKPTVPTPSPTIATEIWRKSVQLPPLILLLHPLPYRFFAYLRNRNRAIPLKNRRGPLRPSRQPRRKIPYYINRINLFFIF